MEKQIQYLTIKNSGKKSNSIDRDSFTCLEINIPTGGKWIKGVKEDAERIIRLC